MQKVNIDDDVWINSQCLLEFGVEKILKEASVKPEGSVIHHCWIYVCLKAEEEEGLMGEAFENFSIF